MQNKNIEKISNNKRIAKNTLLLYCRMLLLMIISLYTSRVILNALGVEDYGIYNVVGGVVSLFSMLSGSISAAISRYMTFELGKRDNKNMQSIFCTAINIQLMIVLAITILLETVGLWFMNNKMVISPERADAAYWCFQFSVITFGVNLLSTPYNAIIVAYERMSAFAYISLFDAISKLAIAFVILLNPIDRLVYYGALVLVAGIIQRYLYVLYCRKHFSECRYTLIFDRKITKEMFGFAGWNFIGASSAVLRDQGGNILINMFCGATVNAARGIAMSVNSAVYGFVANFMIALNPQITKNYASGDYGYMFSLAFQGARLSYYILLILSLPIFVTTPYLLHLWLGIVPEHTSNFTRLVLLFTMSESLASPLVTIMLATGKIKNYQLIVGGLQLLNLPISYVGLKLGFPPEVTFITAIIVSVVCEFARLIMLRKMVGLSIRKFLKDVYINVVIVTVVAAILPLIIDFFIDAYNFKLFSITVLCSVISAMMAIYYVGCTASDRVFITQYVSKFLKKLNDKAK